MRQKIYIVKVHISDDNREEDKKLLTDFQLDMFNNGFKWANDGKSIENFYSSTNIAIIDNLMYTVNKSTIEYLSTEVDVLYYSSPMTFMRFLKFKKLNMIK